MQSFDHIIINMFDPTESALQGTCIIPNVYQCHWEKKYWPHPSRFWPERFLTFDEKAHMSFRPSPNLLAFGAGQLCTISY